jgi:hypothetical protein
MLSWQLHDMRVTIIPWSGLDRSYMLCESDILIFLLNYQYNVDFPWYAALENTNHMFIPSNTTFPDLTTEWWTPWMSLNIFQRHCHVFMWYSTSWKPKHDIYVRVSEVNKRRDYMSTYTEAHKVVVLWFQMLPLLHIE